MKTTIVKFSDDNVAPWEEFEINGFLGDLRTMAIDTGNAFNGGEEDPAKQRAPLAYQVSFYWKAYEIIVTQRMKIKELESKLKELK
jgi:hypothetical protein